MSKAEEIVIEWENQFKNNFPYLMCKKDHDCGYAFYYDKVVFDIIINFLEKFCKDFISNFDKIGSGFHSTVYRYQNDKDILKISNFQIQQIYFTQMLEATHPRFLGYNIISKDGNCATQKFVKCDGESQFKAHNILYKKYKFAGSQYNVGIDGNKAVIIDPY